MTPWLWWVLTVLLFFLPSVSFHNCCHCLFAVRPLEFGFRGRWPAQLCHCLLCRKLRPSRGAHTLPRRPAGCSPCWRWLLATVAAGEGNRHPPNHLSPLFFLFVYPSLPLAVPPLGRGGEGGGRKKMPSISLFYVVPHLQLHRPLKETSCCSFFFPTPTPLKRALKVAARHGSSHG